MTQNFVLKRIPVLVLVVLAVLSACATMVPEPEIPPNLDTYDGLSTAINQGKDILIFDVRTPQEVETGMIPGAVNIPHTEIADALPRSYRNKVIVVYCQSGGRSHAAYEALTDKGFKYVIDFGSIAGWTGELSNN